ncbi:unnamed protein product [Prunus armeniaca]
MKGESVALSAMAVSEWSKHKTTTNENVAFLSILPCWGPTTTHAVTSPNMRCLHSLNFLHNSDIGAQHRTMSVSIVMAWGLLRFLGQNGVAGCKRMAAMPRVLQ